MIERYFPSMMVGGLALALLGYLTIVFLAFRYKFRWGLGVVIFFPLGLVYAIRHPKPAWIPALVIALGLAVAAFPPAYTRLTPVDLGPREKLVDGEVHITLTGWDRKDYSPIRLKPEVVVLQMANPDVTDDTLRSIEGFARLRELDLNDTKVTDEGLAAIRTLPALRRLRLRATAVTDRGFAESIAPMESLEQLDLRETAVSPGKVDAWKAAKPNRRAMR